MLERAAGFGFQLVNPDADFSMGHFRSPFLAWNCSTREAASWVSIHPRFRGGEWGGGVTQISEAGRIEQSSHPCSYILALLTTEMKFDLLPSWIKAIAIAETLFLVCVPYLTFPARWNVLYLCQWHRYFLTPAFVPSQVLTECLLCTNNLLSTGDWFSLSFKKYRLSP